MKFCTQVKKEYLEANNVEKKEILNTVLQNSILNGKELSYNYKKPFDLFAKGLSCFKWLPRLSWSLAFNGSTAFLFTSFACSKENSFALSSLPLDSHQGSRLNLKIPDKIRDRATPCLLFCYKKLPRLDSNQQPIG